MMKIKKHEHSAIRIYGLILQEIMFILWKLIFFLCVFVVNIFTTLNIAVILVITLYKIYDFFWFAFFCCKFKCGMLYVKLHLRVEYCCGALCVLILFQWIQICIDPIVSRVKPMKPKMLILLTALNDGNNQSYCPKAGLPHAKFSKHNISNNEMISLNISSGKKNCGLHEMKTGSCSHILHLLDTAHN